MKVINIVHSLHLLDQFDDSKVSIKHMADFGCGKGYDLEFWANMHEWDEDGKSDPKLNFNCVGFDLNAESTSSRHNIKYKNHDFNTDNVIWSVPFDVVWCHNLMQHIYSPVEFLGRVNRAMSLQVVCYICVYHVLLVYNQSTFFKIIHPQKL